MGSNHVNTVWTDEQSQALTGFLTEGLSMAENAAAINERFGTRFTRNAVCGRSYRLGLNAPEKPKVQPKPRKPQSYKPRPKKFNAEYYQHQIQLRCEEVRPDHVNLVDLCENGCRWPYGEGPYTFCNQPQLDGASYCAAHDALAHTTPHSFSDEDRAIRAAHFRRISKPTIEAMQTTDRGPFA